MKKILLKKFVDLSTGEETDSFKELKQWVENRDKVICFFFNGRKISKSTAVVTVNVKEQIFETYSGNVYSVIAMDNDVNKIEPIGFIVNNVEFEFDLGKVQKNVSMGADVKCKYMSTQSGHIIDTKRIISVDLANRLFTTEMGKIYKVLI